MDDTILGSLPGDLISGPVGDDTLFGGGDWPEEHEADTQTIIYGGKLWRRVIVGSLVVRIGETPRICIEYEPV